MTRGWGHHTGHAVHAMGAVVVVFFFGRGGKGRVVNPGLDRTGLDRTGGPGRQPLASGVAKSHREATDGVLYAIVLQCIFIYLDRL